LERALHDLQKLKLPMLVEERYKKFRRMGAFEKA
jgi:acetyl-CoA carboxylase alpha subunit